MCARVHSVDAQGQSASLQDVLDSAEAGDIIELEPGEYTGPFAVRSSVLLVGLAGPDDVVLDAKGRDHVLVVEDEELEVSLSGLTLRGGASGLGGGVAMFGASELDIADCVFDGNAASDAGGGAIFASSGRVRLRDCVFRQNRAGEGGALLLDDVALVSAVNCVFVDNEARRGGAIRLRGRALLSCLHCTFAAGEGGEETTGALVSLSGEDIGRARLRLVNSLAVSRASGSLDIDGAGHEAVAIEASAVPEDWSTWVERMSSGRSVRFEEVPLGEGDGLPRVAAKAAAAGIADWSLSLLGDALVDLDGVPRLEDDRIDPGALEGTA